MKPEQPAGQTEMRNGDWVSLYKLLGRKRPSFKTAPTAEHVLRDHSWL